MTKPCTAAAVLSLVDEGLLDLDAPIDEVLPQLADRRVLRRPDGTLTDTVAAHRSITVRCDQRDTGVEQSITSETTVQ